MTKLAALDELHLEIQAAWEATFNSSVGRAGADGRMTGFIDDVLGAAATNVDPQGLHLRPAHRKGVMHRVVENARAGWVKHWRRVAQEHLRVSTAEVGEVQLARIGEDG